MGVIISKSYQKTACAEQTMLSSQEESNKYASENVRSMGWSYTVHQLSLEVTSCMERT